MPGGEARDDDGGGLEACISADGGNHGDKGNGGGEDSCEIFKAEFVMEEHQDQGGDTGSEEAGEQPCHSDACGVEDGDIVELVGVSAGHCV